MENNSTSAAEAAEVAPPEAAEPEAATTAPVTNTETTPTPAAPANESNTVEEESKPEEEAAAATTAADETPNEVEEEEAAVREEASVPEEDKFADADDAEVAPAKEALEETSTQPADNMDVDLDAAPTVQEEVVVVEEEESKPEEEEEAKPQEITTIQEDVRMEEAAPAAEEEAPIDMPVETTTTTIAEESSLPAVWEPQDADVLSGRGASVNAHGGNKKFRALCFCRKPEFDAGNHAAKRRIATEIVSATSNRGSARFLKKKIDKGPWHEMTTEQAILKACQVMRDYKRPDRLAIREMMQQNGSARKRTRQQESTPMLDTPIPTGPLEPIIENPFGVHDHDILSGRGAFVNGHIGNSRLRTLALDRKIQFDSGNYTEKRALATEVVQIIRTLDPPGRFLKRVAASAKKPAKEGNDWILPPRGLDGTWEELNDEKAIHKACQVMRDIDRPDRKDRELRRAKKKQKVLDGGSDETPSGGESPVHHHHHHHAEGTSLAEDADNTARRTKPGAAAAAPAATESKDSMTVLAETTAEKAAVEEAVAATEEALDKALDAVPDASKKEAALAAAAAAAAVEHVSETAVV